MDDLLENRVIIVTGAGGGLGRAYAIAAAAVGARVVVNDLPGGALDAVVEEISREGGAAVAAPFDLSSPEGCDAVVDAALQAFGRIDGLVNNAAIYHAKSILDETTDGMRKLIEVNLLGVMWLTRATVLAMRQTGGGAIVNVTSGAAQGILGMSSYGAAKGGVLALTYNWALDLAEHGVRVNAISPRANTSMALGTDEARQFTSEGRTPDKIAPVVLYLLSDAAAAINGRVIRFDGEALSMLDLPHMEAQAFREGRWTIEEVAEYFSKLPHELLAENSMAQMIAASR